MTAALLERPAPMPAAPPVRHPADWQLSGACNGLVTATCDPWLPDDELPPSEQERLEAFARSVCAGCPVRQACLADALARREPNGIRGGLDPQQRRALARRSGYVRASVYGTAGHGSNSRYQSCTDGPDGKACAKCLRGHADYVRGWRLRRSWTTGFDTSRGTLFVIEKPSGRGLHRVWPGQLFWPIGVAS